MVRSRGGSKAQANALHITDGQNAGDQEVQGEQLLRWLCGSWRDQKGSSYLVSMAEDGSTVVSTTRPWGAVIKTGGIIRVDASRVVWGKQGARFQYALHRLNDRALRWHGDGSAKPFEWERQGSLDNDPAPAQTAQDPATEHGKGRAVCKDAAVEQDEPWRINLAERRAQLRREFQEQRSAAESNASGAKQAQSRNRTREKVEAKVERQHGQETNHAKSFVLKQLLGVQGENAKNACGRIAGEQLLQMVGGSKRNSPNTSEGYVAALEQQALQFMEQPWPLPPLTYQPIRQDLTNGFPQGDFRSWSQWPPQSVTDLQALSRAQLDAQYYLYISSLMTAYESSGSLEGLMPTGT